MGSKKRKKKQVKRQEYMKRKQEQNIPFQKVVLMIEKYFDIFVCSCM